MAVAGHIPGDVGHVHGAAGKSDGNGRTQPDVRRVVCRQDELQERIMVDLAGPETIKPHAFSGAGGGQNALRGIGLKCNIELHVDNSVNKCR